MARFEYRFLLILAIISLLFYTCQPQLERKGIPVWVGISLDESCQADKFIEQIKVFESYPLAGLNIEVPLEVNPSELSGSFKYYEAHPLDTLVEYLKRDGIAFSLTFDLKNPRKTSLSRIDWKKHFTDISGILLRTSSYPPQHITFMGEWVNPRLPKTLLTGFIDQIYDDFAPFKGEIVYAVFPHALDDSLDWETPDLIGIRYQEPPEENSIPYYRKTNQEISQKLNELQKPTIIVQSNLIGEKKLTNFKYQLRYWDEKSDIRGITLNSLYCDLSLTDKRSYFALGEDDDFLNFLKEYLN